VGRTTNDFTAADFLEGRISVVACRLTSNAESNEKNLGTRKVYFKVGQATTFNEGSE
jgi:hypothetical protein